MTPKALKHAIEQIEMDEAMQARVLRRSLDAMEEHDTMKQKRNYKRIAIVAVAAVMALSVTAFAAVRNQVKVTWTDRATEVHTLSEAQEIMDAAKIDMTLPETLPGGYTFESANVARSALAEEKDTEDPQNVQILTGENGIVYSFTGEAGGDTVSCVYEKDGAKVYLDAGTVSADVSAEDCETVEKGGMTFRCVEGGTTSVSTAVMTDADVPEDFDPENFDPEELDLSAFDVDTQEGSHCSIFWEKDGISYTLFQLNGELTRDQLMDMALTLCGK